MKKKTREGRIVCPVYFSEKYFIQGAEHESQEETDKILGVQVANCSRSCHHHNLHGFDRNHGYHHNHGILITIAGFFCAKTAAMVVPEIGEEMGAPAKGDIIPKA